MMLDTVPFTFVVFFLHVIALRSAMMDGHVSPCCMSLYISMMWCLVTLCRYFTLQVSHARENKFYTPSNIETII